MTDSMLSLFRRCLYTEYTHAGEDGDYAIETEGRTLYLLFEWSNGVRDWVNNLSFPVKPYRHMGEKWYCHRGFLRVWRAISDEVETAVADTILRYPGLSEIVTVGYSHGAALALLATEDMVYRFGERNVYGFGFGCPRVVFGTPPASVTERFRGFTMIRNVPDLVTHVPPAVFGYRHIGRIQEIGKGNGYGPIGAHTPKAYLRSLTQLRNGVTGTPSGLFT